MGFGTHFTVKTCDIFFCIELNCLQCLRTCAVVGSIFSEFEFVCCWYAKDRTVFFNDTFGSLTGKNMQNMYNTKSMSLFSQVISQ